MKSSHRFALLGICLFALMCLAAPTQTEATILWGHPYAMQTNAVDNGWVHMWNDNASPPYVGTGTLTPIGAGSANQHTWDLLVQGMVNKKLTFLWITNTANTPVNDGSTGPIVGAVVTIFGN